MRRFVIGTMLAVTGILASTNAADACHRRRSCHGCHGGTVVYSSCSGAVARGCHGCHGGTVYYGNGGRTSYYPNQQVVPQGELVPAPSNKTGETQTNVGVIDFRAPADAQIWVDGQLVNRTGDAWRYTTPSLRNGQRQSYQVKASWNVDGRIVSQTRTVTVEPGGRMNVDFTASSSSSPRGERVTPPSINPKQSNP